MKKPLLFFSALILLLSSCSNDDSPSNPSNPSTPSTPSNSLNVLIKKMIIINTQEGTSEINFTYEGKKLVEQKSTGYLNYTKRFYYTGDLITKYEVMSGANNTIVTDLTYEKGKLKTLSENRRYLYTGAAYVKKTTYTYNADDSVSFVTNDIDKETNKITSTRTGKLTYVNGNLVKDERFDDPTGFISTVLEYDTKNNPSKNVIGFNLLLGYSDFNYSANNKSKLTTNGVYSSPWTVYTTYEYDENNFPTVAKHSDETGDVYATTKYFY